VRPTVRVWLPGTAGRRRPAEGAAACAPSGGARTQVRGAGPAFPPDPRPRTSYRSAAGLVSIEPLDCGRIRSLLDTLTATTERITRAPGGRAPVSL
jgi:hypothetical protein